MRSRRHGSSESAGGDPEGHRLPLMMRFGCPNPKSRKPVVGIGSLLPDQEPCAGNQAKVLGLIV